MCNASLIWSYLWYVKYVHMHSVGYHTIALYHSASCTQQSQHALVCIHVYYQIYIYEYIYIYILCILYTTQYDCILCTTTVSTCASACCDTPDTSHPLPEALVWRAQVHDMSAIWHILCAQRAYWGACARVTQAQLHTPDLWDTHVDARLGSPLLLASFSRTFSRTISRLLGQRQTQVYSTQVHSCL